MFDARIARLLKAAAPCAAALLAHAWAAAPAAAQTPAEKVNFQDHVLPVFRNACLSCHNPDKKKAGLDLSTFAASIAGGDNGSVVAPGDANASKLYKVMTHAEEPAMPPKKEKLPEKELAVVRKWIDGGALETATGKPIAAAKKAVDLSVVASAGKPTGPVAFPKGLLAEAVVRTERTGAVVSMANSPWAPLVAVGGQKQVLLYHTGTLDIVGVLPFPEGLPHVLKFSPNGSLLLAGGGVAAKTGKVVLFDVASGSRVTEVGDEFDAVLAADISGDQSVVVLGGPGKVVKGYAVADGKLLYTIKKHTDWVTAIAASPDGETVATADRAGGISVWEVKTGLEVATLQGHRDAVTSLAFRDDSKVLASCSVDGSAKLWNMVEDGKELKTWAAHGTYRPPPAAVGAGTFDPKVGAFSIAFTHDGRLVSAGRDGGVKLWDPLGNAVKALEPAFPDQALRASFDFEGSRVVAGDWNGQLRVWSVPDGKVVGELSLNPPPIAERLAAAEKKLADAGPALEKAKAEHAAALEAVKRAEAELQGLTANAQKAVTEAEAKAKAATDAMAATKADAENKATQAKKLAAAAAELAQQATKVASAGGGAQAAGPDVAPLEAAVAATQATLDEAAKRVAAAEAALAKNKDDAAAKAELESAKASRDRRTQRLADAKKALDAARQAKGGGKPDAPNEAAAKARDEAEKAAAAAKAAQQAADAAQQAAEKAKADAKAATDAVAKAKADVDAAAKQVQPKTEAVKAANDAVAKAKAAAETAEAQLKQLQFGVAKLKADSAATTLAKARSALSDREAEQAAAQEAAKAAKAAAEKAAADATAFEQGLPKAPERYLAKRAALDQAKATSGVANTAAEAAQADLKQREAMADLATQLFQQATAAAAKAKENKALAKVVEQSKATSDLLAEELKAVKEVAAAKAAEAKKAADAVPAAEAELAKARNERDNGPTILAQLKQAAAAAAADVPKKQAAADAAAKPVADAKAKVDQLRADYEKLDREAQQIATPANAPTTPQAKS